MSNSNASEMPKKLNHFTSFENLLLILIDDCIYFSDPQYWEDKNDVELMDLYKKSKHINTLLALCFSDDLETIHHWKYFKAGCCIEFDVEKLLGKFQGEGYEKKKVQYVKIKDFIPDKYSIDDLPFVKRYPYRVENEYRIIYESKKKDDSHEKIKGVIDTIKKITIGGNDLEIKRRKQMLETIKTTIKSSISENLINQSTIFRNDEWINKARDIVKKN